MESLIIFIFTILIVFEVYYILKIKRSTAIKVTNSNFKYPQGRDCKLVVDGKTLKQLNNEGKYVVIITSDNLNPDYSNGDFVIISRIIPEKIKRDQYVLVKTIEGRMIVKIQRVHRDGTWTVMYDEFFKFKIYSKEKIEGIIVNKIRRG